MNVSSLRWKVSGVLESEQANLSTSWPRVLSEEGMGGGQWPRKERCLPLYVASVNAQVVISRLLRGTIANRTYGIHKKRYI